MNADLEDKPPTVCQIRGRHSAVAFNIELAGLLMLPPASNAMQTLLKADLQRAFAEKSLLTVGEPDPARGFQPRHTSAVFAFGNYVYGLFILSDWLQGLAVLETELKRTGLFADAETGWYCPDELIWRRHYPATDASPFIPKVFDTAKHLVNTKMLQTLAWMAAHCSPPQKP
jgi:hypothetical protein